MQLNYLTKPLNQNRMKQTLIISVAIIGLLFLEGYCESKKKPYEEGMHWSYSIECENGFVYKTLGHREGTIQIFNSDGTPLKCGEEIY
jgi:hypothetical protein